MACAVRRHTFPHELRVPTSVLPFAMLRSADTEIELKLRVPGTHYGALARHPALFHTGDRPRHPKQRLYAVYYDTPRNELWRAGMALRVRRDGATRTQTLKGGGSVDAGLHERVELEVALAAGETPDLGLFAAGTWPDRARAIIGNEPLRPVFVTRFARETRLVQRAGAIVEASLDRGYVRAGQAREPICELELELKAGRPAVLYEIALELIASVPLAIESRSKAERGYALHANADAAPAKGEPIRLVASMTVGDAVQAILRAVLAHIQANEHGLLHGDDAEFVHQMRVALRRLRSMFSIFRPVLDRARVEPLASEARALSQALGAARDWDVFMDAVHAPALRALPRHPGFRAYGQAFRKRRRLARRRAQRAVASQRYQRLLLQLGTWLHERPWCDAASPDVAGILQQPIAAYAADVLEARYAALRKRGRHVERQSTEELHALRIAAKKLRYAAQFFVALYDADTANALIEHLARLQDALGALYDAASAQTLVDGAPPAAASRAVAEARGMLLGWSRGQEPLLRREAERSWRSLRRCATFW